MNVGDKFAKVPSAYSSKTSLEIYSKPPWEDTVGCRISISYLWSERDCERDLFGIRQRGRLKSTEQNFQFLYQQNIDKN